MSASVTAATSVDLSRYFARIGYTGPREATLDVLRALHALHPRTIPFENLSPLGGRDVDIGLPAVQAKLVDGGRGGYCFEQNALFTDVLAQLGFKVSPLISRVSWGASFETSAPLMHRMVRVDLDGEAWLADVGFGGVTLTAPLRLDVEGAQSTTHEDFQITRTGDGEHRLSVRAGYGWLPVYRFLLRPAEVVDFQVGNWYTSKATDSLFVNHLLACRVLPEGRLAMFDTELTERDAKGAVVAQSKVDSAAALAAVLTDRFGLTLDGVDVDAAFARISQPAASA